MDSNPVHFSREELDKIQARIVELTAKITESNEQQDKLFGRENRQLLPEVWTWNKELRKLRRIRDNQ